METDGPDIAPTSPSPSGRGVRGEGKNEQGIRVVRFWSNDVLQQTDSVLQALWQEVHLPSPQPLSQRERGLEEPSLSHE